MILKVTKKKLFFRIMAEKDRLNKLSNFSLFRHMNVLVVEDDIQTAEYLKNTISQLFNDVYVAYDGEHGLDLFYDKNPDILFVDIMMPKINGLEMIREIRKTNDQVKIIIITAHNTLEYLHQAVALKLEDYLIKPIGFSDFLSVMEKIANAYTLKYPQKIFLESGAELYLHERKGLYNDIHFTLTSLECKLVELLITYTNQIVSKEIIENHLYFGDPKSDSALKGLINKIRQKIGKTAIQSHSGFGYKMIIR